MKQGPRKDPTNVEDWWEDEIKELGIQSTTKQAYLDQMYFATSYRKLGWMFDYYSWCKVWVESGKWEQRGRMADEFCMCRFGDIGPYSPSNVWIGTNKENISDSFKNNGKPKPPRAKNPKSKKELKYYLKYGDVIYRTIQELADFNGYCSRTINNWIKQGKVYRISKTITKEVKEIHTPYGVFENLTQAALAESVTKAPRRQTIYHRVHNPNFPDYFEKYVTKQIPLYLKEDKS